LRLLAIAGEASGDVHGSGVLRELKRLHPAIEVFGIGGDKMAAEGMQLLYHVRDVAFMGFVEVIKHLPTIRNIERTMLQAIIQRKPDAVLLIDYPGFNIRFARKAKALGLKVFYYISPQIWAWKQGRLKKIKQSIDKMFVVFPFELSIYEKENIPVEYVGHPLIEEMAEPISKNELCKQVGFDTNKKIIGLFPGSRKQEVERILPAMLRAGRMLKNEFDVNVGIACAPTISKELLKKMSSEEQGIAIIENSTRALMKHSDVAIVTSGTATLETALFQTPMVIVYKTSLLTYLIGKAVVKVPYIGLVNILAKNLIVPELIQSEATPQRMFDEVKKILTEKDRYDITKKQLSQLRDTLGTSGASRRVAESIGQLWKQ